MSQSTFYQHILLLYDIDATQNSQEDPTQMFFSNLLAIQMRLNEKDNCGNVTVIWGKTVDKINCT
jgi:hypothetical protein